MAANLSPEYRAAETAYKKARDSQERLDCLREMLRTIKHVTFLNSWELWSEASDEGEDELPDPFAVRLPTLMLANKADLLDDPAEELEVFRELSAPFMKQGDYDTMLVSAETGEGLEAIAPYLFERLGIVRVYSKAPGHEPNRDRPFTLRRGQTINDVAAMVHKDVARTLKFARVWGTATFDGQQVSRDHPVCDGDIVELHASAVQLHGEPTSPRRARAAPRPRCPPAPALPARAARPVRALISEHGGLRADLVGSDVL